MGVEMGNYQGVFKAKYGEQLEGRDWVRKIEPEDRQVFIEIGLSEMQYGHLGGVARAQTAARDSRGRFAPKGGKDGSE